MQILDFVKWIGSKEAYEHPLILNVEPEGDQEFLEAKIRSEGKKLWAHLYNKVTVDIMAGKQPYRRRLPARSSVAVADQVDLIGGTITRIRQLTKVDSSLLDCLLDLRIEAKSAGYSPQAFRKALQRLSSNGSKVLTEEEKEMFIMSSQVGEKAIKRWYFNRP